MAYIYNLVDTWNDSLTTFTAIKMNVTDTASDAASLLMDLQVGTVSRFSVNKGGAVTFAAGLNIQTTPGSGTWSFTPTAGSKQIQAFDGAILSLNPVGNNVGIGITSATQGLTVRSTYGIAWDNGSGTADTILTRRATANLRFGAADAASPVAQTLSVQSVVAGTTNTAGTALTITGSQGTGTGAGGSIVFQVAPAGSSGTAQNALADALTINSAKQMIFAGTGAYTTPVIASAAGTTSGIGFNSIEVAVIRSGAGHTIFNSDACEVQLTAGGFRVQNAGFMSFGLDTLLRRDAANTLALRNGTAAQGFNIYNTYTDASNYELGRLQWAGNNLYLQTLPAGTGTSRGIIIQAANGNLSLSNTHLMFLADNSYDIGASGATRPRSVYAGTSITPGRGVTVAGLPTPSTGMIARVTDALAPATGATVVGGGAAQALVWYNGANWTVIGV